MEPTIAFGLALLLVVGILIAAAGTYVVAAAAAARRAALLVAGGALLVGAVVVLVALKTAPPNAALRSTPPTPTASLPPLHQHQSGFAEVSALDYWQETAFSIRPGDHIVITYVSGLWSYAPSQPLSDANGPPEQFICTQHFSVAQCSGPYGVPDAVQGSLVGRIGTQLLKVGDHLDVVAEQAGPLELAINDGYNADNRGSIVVKIAVN